MRPAALVLLLAFVLSATGCGRSDRSLAHRPGWQIHARLEFLSADLRAERAAPPEASYRLWFPYVVGDLYGAPGTGDFVHATVRRPASAQPQASAQAQASVEGGPRTMIDIDLGATERDLVRSLEPTEFSLSYLKIEPASARIARLAPAALQANGIDPVGTAEWVDLDTRAPLMLVYADGPARISGQTNARGTSVRYDIRFPAAGYVWVARREAAGARRGAAGEVLYEAVPAPRRLALAVVPLERE